MTNNKVYKISSEHDSFDRAPEINNLTFENFVKFYLICILIYKSLARLENRHASTAR